MSIVNKINSDNFKYIHKSESEIKTFMESLYEEQQDINWRTSYFDNYKDYPDKIEFTFRNEYDKLDMNTEILFKMIQFFNTDQIDFDDNDSGGCETCDWGSRYGHDFTIWKGNKKK